MDICNKSNIKNYITAMHQFVLRSDGHEGGRCLFQESTSCRACSIIQVDVKETIEDSIVTVLLKTKINQTQYLERPDLVLRKALLWRPSRVNDITQKKYRGKKISFLQETVTNERCHNEF